MPEPHAWQCGNPRCVTRNAWKATACRRCPWTREHGRALYPDEAVGSSQALPDWLVLLLIPLCLFLPASFIFPYLILIVLCWIGLGVWRLVGQQKR